jgi:hypothetical protein
MIEPAVVIAYLEPLQIYIAAVFIPLVCWYLALCSGYAVQIGLFFLLDDVGLPTNLLILIASAAAYFWIATALLQIPGMARKTPDPVKPAEP